MTNEEVIAKYEHFIETNSDTVCGELERWKLVVTALREQAEHKHGKWVYSRTESELAVDKCSVCGKEQFAISGVVAQGNYCPNCGAKMDERRESEVSE